MPKPRILPFRQLTSADQNLLPIVPVTIANRQSGRFRPNRIFFVEFPLFLLESGHKHAVQPRSNALSHDRAVNLDDRIFRRRLLPLAVQSAQKRREVKSSTADNDNRHIRGNRFHPFRRRTQPGTGRKLFRWRHHVNAAHVEFLDLVSRRFGRPDVHTRIDEHRIGAQDPSAHLPGQGRGNRALAACRWSGQEIGLAFDHSTFILGRSEMSTKPTSRPSTSQTGKSSICLRSKTFRSSAA